MCVRNRFLTIQQPTMQKQEYLQVLMIYCINQNQQKIFLQIVQKVFEHILIDGRIQSSKISQQPIQNTFKMKKEKKHLIYKKVQTLQMGLISLKFQSYKHFVQIISSSRLIKQLPSRILHHWPVFCWLYFKICSNAQHLGDLIINISHQIYFFYYQKYYMYSKPKHPNTARYDNSLPRSSHPDLKQSQKPSKKKDTVSQQVDILIKTCCPNCRYVFKVVDQSKLRSMRNRMRILNPILQQESQQSKSIQVKGNQTFLFNNKEQNKQLLVNQQNLLIKQQNLPQISQVNAIKYTANQINQQKLKASKIIQNLNANLNLNSNQFKNVQTKKNQKYINNSNIKIEEEKEKKMNQQTNIHENIAQLKKYLNRGHNGGQSGHSGEEKDIKKTRKNSKNKKKQKMNLKVNNLPLYSKEQVYIEDYSLIQEKQALQNILDIQFSTINKPESKCVEIKRKFSGQEEIPIEMDIALQAAKAQLIEGEAEIIANYVQKNVYTPSYIKSLGLLLGSI